MYFISIMFKTILRGWRAGVNYLSPRPQEIQISHISSNKCDLVVISSSSYQLNLRWRSQYREWATARAARKFWFEFPSG
jgi:hypothetical protein